MVGQSEVRECTHTWSSVGGFANTIYPAHLMFYEGIQSDVDSEASERDNRGEERKQCGEQRHCDMR